MKTFAKTLRGRKYEIRAQEEVDADDAISALNGKMEEDMQSGGDRPLYDMLTDVEMEAQDHGIKIRFIRSNR